jgi:TRAP-type C4-dicarboxylate transport system substrate-binding protein
MLRKATTLLAAGAVLLALATAPALAQKQTLHMAYWAGPSHHMVQDQEEWGKKVTEYSKGNLTIEIDKAPLAKPEGQYDLVKNGVRDLVWHVTGYTEGRFPMIQAIELPFLCPSAAVCAPALWKWYAKYKLAAKEFPDTELLATFNHGPGAIHTAKPVHTLEDIKGVKIRVGGSAVPIAKALGMSVVAMPATDAYEAMQRGTVDGVMFPWEAMKSFRLNEMAKFHLEIPGGLYTAAFVIVGNKKAIANLTPENRDALMKASGEAGSRIFGERWDQADKVSREDAVEKKNQIEMLAAAELERWKPKLQFVTDAWLKQAKDKGYDGEAMLNDLKAIIKSTASM